MEGRPEWELNKHLCEVEIISLCVHLLDAGMQASNATPVKGDQPAAPFKDWCGNMSKIALWTGAYLYENHFRPNRRVDKS